MKKALPYLIPLIIAFLILAAGLLMCMVQSWNLFPLGIAMVGFGTLVMLITAVLRMISARTRFQFNLKFVLKLVFTAAAFIMFTVGLGLIIVAHVVVLGIVLAAIGLFAIIFIVPMFVAFVRANPFEHVIITPNYDDIDTEFFRDPKNK